jgi:hypothetical protein
VFLAAICHPKIFLSSVWCTNVFTVEQQKGLQEYNKLFFHYSTIQEELKSRVNNPGSLVLNKSWVS